MRHRSVAGKPRDGNNKDEQQEPATHPNLHGTRPATLS